MGEGVWFPRPTRCRRPCKKIKIGHPECSLSLTPLHLTTSYFSLTLHPTPLKVDVICVLPLIAVSIVVKEELANEIVNYDTKLKQFLLKRDFNTGVFLWNLQNFQGHLFPYEIQCLLLRFNLCFQRSVEQKLVRLSAINMRFSLIQLKKVFATVKIQK